MQQGWRVPSPSHHSYPTLIQSYRPTYAPYPIPQPSLPQLCQPMPPLPLPLPFRPPQLSAQPLPNPNNNAIQMIHSVNPLSSSRYHSMPVGVNNLQLRSRKIVTSENQKKPMVSMRKVRRKLLTIMKIYHHLAYPHTFLSFSIFFQPISLSREVSCGEE